MFGMWAIVSAPLVLSFDVTKRDADGGLTLDRVWPIITNKEAIAVNQRWDGSPGRLLLTDKAVLAPPTKGGYIPYPGQLGQARGWQNVPGDVGADPLVLSASPPSRRPTVHHRLFMLGSEIRGRCVLPPPPLFFF